MPLNSRSSAFGVSDADALLTSWSAAQYKIYQEQGSIHQHFLVRFLEKIQPLEFDCCDIGGWRPGENELSNVIAAIFDPRWQHGFNVACFDALLALIATKPSLESAQKTIASIKALIPEDKSKLRVIREGAGDTSRSDIELIGRDFLICIEHKSRGGLETDVGGLPQTVRLLKDARRKAKAQRITSDRVIGVLLSPEGKPAESDEFIAIQYGELATAITSAICTSSGGAAASIRGFMAYYGRRF
jgi:hypothetical protein